MRVILKPVGVGMGLIIVLAGFVMLRSMFFMPLSTPCQQTITWSGSAPHGAIWRQETVHWDQVPAGYTTLVGWMNAVTDVPCADEERTSPRIVIRRFRILSQDSSGREQIEREIELGRADSFIGRLFPRTPHWFSETKGSRVVKGVVNHTDGRLTLNLTAVPLRVYHAWTDPRIPIDPERHYFIEGEVNITGTARLQVGIDYWRDMNSDYQGWDSTCALSNNCEGWVSDWYGDTGGKFRTFRAPLGLKYGNR